LHLLYTLLRPCPLSSFLFHATATTPLYTLSLHDALPISATAFPCGSSTAPVARTTGAAASRSRAGACSICATAWPRTSRISCARDRKSTRLNSSHLGISYAVFCLKKKKKNTKQQCSTQCK